MTPQEVLAWFDELAANKNGAARNATMDWMTQMQAAMEAAFPPGHAVRTRLQAAMTPLSEGSRNVLVQIDVAGIFDAAHSILKAGRLKSLIASAQAETVREVLEQAEHLLDVNVIAATVLAGGALETHLHQLCNTNAIPWNGEGSISKYNDAIGHARNTGTCTVYEANVGKDVTAWGGKRNDAAHHPTEFKWSREEIRLMIFQVRHFIDRTS